MYIKRYISGDLLFRNRKKLLHLCLHLHRIGHSGVNHIHLIKFSRQEIIHDLFFNDSGPAHVRLLYGIPEILFHWYSLFNKILMPQFTYDEQHGITTLVNLLLGQFKYIMIISTRKSLISRNHDVSDLTVFFLDLRPGIQIRIINIRCMSDNSCDGALQCIKIRLRISQGFPCPFKL